MIVTINTGAGGRYGLGHASRCLALASALAAQGATVSFLTQTPFLTAVVAPFPCRLYRHVWPALPLDVLVDALHLLGAVVVLPTLGVVERLLRIGGFLRVVGVPEDLEAELLADHRQQEQRVARIARQVGQGRQAHVGAC